MKIKKDALVTKGYLDEVLDSRFNEFFNRLVEYLDFRLEPLEEEAKKSAKFRKFTTDKLDWLVGKYTKFEEEHMILTHQQIELNKKLETHTH